MPAVKQIWPVKQYRIPDYTVLWAGQASENDEITRRASQDTFSPHLMTQVHMLREKGVVGDGIKVAIVDSGVRQARLPPSGPRPPSPS